MQIKELVTIASQFSIFMLYYGKRYFLNLSREWTKSAALDAKIWRN